MDADVRQVRRGRLVVRPVWGCYLVGDPQYSNQWTFNGGVLVRF